MEQAYLSYGTPSSAQTVLTVTQHLITQNLAAEARGQQKFPICIWGTHGIGKTELVQQLAKTLDYQWAYVAPAQFEEMGDLLGMPSIQDGQTIFHPPSWVPTTEGPGILLLDDINRADDRILRGLMQLLQNYELVSWKLPPQWQIVLTANPEGGDYSVTPLDDAMLTRMMHISLKFSAKDWAIWAAKNQVDPRGIDFVLRHPELVTGQRTTPRTLVQFFSNIAAIPKLTEALPLVQLLGAACLDEATVAAFIHFVQQEEANIITPAAICKATEFESQVYKPLQAIVQQETLRVDILAALCTRLKNHLVVNNSSPKGKELQNLQDFIKMDFLPNDLRLSFLQDLINAENKKLKAVLDDPSIAQLLLQKM